METDAATPGAAPVSSAAAPPAISRSPSPLPTLRALADANPLVSADAWRRAMPFFEPRTLLLVAAAHEQLAVLAAEMVEDRLDARLFPNSYRGLLCHAEAEECRYDAALLLADETPPATEDERERLVRDVCVPTAIIRPHVGDLLAALGEVSLATRLRLLCSLSPRNWTESMEIGTCVMDGVECVALDPRHPVLLYVERWRTRIDLAEISTRLCWRFGASDPSDAIDTRIAGEQVAADSPAYLAASTFSMVRNLVHSDIAAFVQLGQAEIERLRLGSATLGDRMLEMALYNFNNQWLSRPNRIRSLAMRCGVL